MPDPYLRGLLQSPYANLLASSVRDNQDKPARLHLLLRQLQTEKLEASLTITITRQLFVPCHSSQDPMRPHSHTLQTIYSSALAPTSRTLLFFHAIGAVVLFFVLCLLRLLSGTIASKAHVSSCLLSITGHTEDTQDIQPFTAQTNTHTSKCPHATNLADGHWAARSKSQQQLRSALPRAQLNDSKVNRTACNGS